MKLVELLALEFAKGGALSDHDHNDWPEDVVASHSYSEVSFDNWEYLYKSSYSNDEWMTTVSFDVDGKLKHREEYDAEEVTRDEYFAFIEANPTFLADLEAKRKVNIGRIAELNKIAYDAVDEAIKLSRDEAISDCKYAKSLGVFALTQHFCIWAGYRSLDNASDHEYREAINEIKEKLGSEECLLK